MNNLVVIEKDGILVIDSREVAKVLEMRHGNLVRDIENYVESLENSENSKLSSDVFFIESTYTVAGNNKKIKPVKLDLENYYFGTMYYTI